jgi:hypothetical protein
MEDQGACDDAILDPLSSILNLCLILKLETLILPVAP